MPALITTMTGESTIKIIRDISQLINAGDGDCSAWHIGATSDPERQLFQERGIPRDFRWVITRRAMSAQEARAIVRGFVNLSCRLVKDSGDADYEAAVHVFAFRQPPSAALAAAPPSNQRPVV